MKSLSKQEICSIIEGNGHASRVPIMFNMWINPSRHGELETQIADICKKYPYDLEHRDMRMPTMYMEKENPNFSWVKKEKPIIANAALDASIAMPTWDNLDEVFANFPDPYNVNICSPMEENKDQYVLARWFYCFFERLWSLRGMENALTDLYLYPDEVHRIFQWLTDFYIVLIERAHDELHADGIFTSDDIGTQTSPFFSLDIFREFFKPYYKQLIDKAHSLNMHFWLHTCGNIELFLPDFIEIGLDVIHPIQKYTMDEKVIAEKYGADICILAGFDVQHVIPYGTVDDVKEEVHQMIDTYFRPDGKFLLTVGNGSTPDWKLESVEALYSETLTYGTKKAMVE